MAAVMDYQLLKALRESILHTHLSTASYLHKQKKELVLPDSCLQFMDTIVTILTFLFIGNISLSYPSGKKHLIPTLTA